MDSGPIQYDGQYMTTDEVVVYLDTTDSDANVRSEKEERPHVSDNDGESEHGEQKADSETSDSESSAGEDEFDSNPTKCYYGKNQDEMGEGSSKTSTDHNQLDDSITEIDWTYSPIQAP